MQQHGRIEETWCWANKARHKRNITYDSIYIVLKADNIKLGGLEVHTRMGKPKRKEFSFYVQVRAVGSSQVGEAGSGIQKNHIGPSEVDRRLFLILVVIS